jgi:hypothetical protein
VRIMMELNDKIGRLEMLIEQYIIHVRLQKGRAANREKSDLLNMLHQLRWYKAQREQLEDERGTVEIAA